LLVSDAMSDQQGKDPLGAQIVDFYSTDFPEEDRLGQDIGQMEWRRTISILKRHLPKPPAVVLDVGGATGRYALWLLDKGYETRLLGIGKKTAFK
jgi:hypothetical protein